MVIDDLDIVGVVLAPHEADAVLPVDANAVLTLSIALQFFQIQTRPNCQVLEQLRGVEQYELLQCYPMKLNWQHTPCPFAPPLVRDIRRSFVRERSDRHRRTILPLAG